MLWLTFESWHVVGEDADDAASEDRAKLELQEGDGDTHDGQQQVVRNQEQTCNIGQYNVYHKWC